MKTFLENKYIKAVGFLLMISAGLHMTALVIITIIERDVTHLNYFKLLSIDYFVPMTFTTTNTLLISIIPVCLYIYLVWRLGKKS